MSCPNRRCWLTMDPPCACSVTHIQLTITEAFYSTGDRLEAGSSSALFKISSISADFRKYSDHEQSGESRHWYIDEKQVNRNSEAKPVISKFSHVLLDPAIMPPKKGSKKKTTKAAPKQPPPQPSPSPVPERPKDVVPQGQEQEPEDVQMEPPAEPKEAEPLTVVETIKDVAEAAGEFVESMNGEDVEKEQEPESKLSMEERKAKMEQLRTKMVHSAVQSFYVIYSPNHMFCSLCSAHPPRQTAPRSLKKPPNQRRQRGTSHGWRSKESWRRCCGLKRMQRRGGRMWRETRIGSGQLRRMRHGRGSWLGKLGGRISNFMVRPPFIIPSLLVVCEIWPDLLFSNI